MLLVGSVTWAQDAARELQSGQRYQGGEWVRDASHRLVFRLPETWAGRIAPDGEALLLTAPQQAGVGIVTILGGMSPDALIERLSEPQDFGGDVLLQLSRPLEQQEGRWRAAYLSGTVIGRAVALLGPDELAVVYFFAGPQAEASAYDALLDALANSTRFGAVTGL